MKTLIAASLLFFSAQTASAQVSGIYQFRLTADQVVSGPGASGPGGMNGYLYVGTTASGPRLSFIGTSIGILDVTEMAIHGPATATTTGPVLEMIPFTQQVNSGFATGNLFDFPISTTTRDIILSGQAYVEVRSLLYPGGALRGAIGTNVSLCSPEDPNPQSCGECPCGNSPLVDSGGGCRNSQGGSARLFVTGVAALSADSLDFAVGSASSNSVALLISGDNLLPLGLGVCPGGSGLTDALTDGLRCVGGQVLRHGVRPTDADGSTASGAFTPPGGVLAQNGFMAGQTRAFQGFYRDVATSPCGTGLNTTNAILLSFVL